MENTAISLGSNHLGFFDKKGDVKIDKVVDFMEISRNELAQAFGLTGEQIRPDRISPKTKEIISELAGAIEYVSSIFKGDVTDTRHWFNLPNMHFGGSSPKTLILRGRFHRIKQFIYASQMR